MPGEYFGLLDTMERGVAPNDLGSTKTRQNKKTGKGK